MQGAHNVLLQQAPTEEADQLAPLDVPGDKQPLALVTGVHVPHVCATHLMSHWICLMINVCKIHLDCVHLKRI